MKIIDRLRSFKVTENAEHGRRHNKEIGVFEASIAYREALLYSGAKPGRAKRIGDWVSVTDARELAQLYTWLERDKVILCLMRAAARRQSGETVRLTPKDKSYLEHAGFRIGHVGGLCADRSVDGRHAYFVSWDK